MKAVLEFELPTEQEEFDLALNGRRYKATVDDIWMEVFRPHYKHGYSNQRLNELSDTEIGSELIDLLAEVYRDVLRANED